MDSPAGKGEETTHVQTNNCVPKYDEDYMHLSHQHLAAEKLPLKVQS